MAAIFPFAALRPTPASVARVASVPYDVVNSDEARRSPPTTRSASCVCRVPRSSARRHPIYADEVYARAATTSTGCAAPRRSWSKTTPSLYVYRLHMGAHVQTGVAACFSVDEYERDLIKKHEKTRPDKEDDRTRHMLALARRPVRCS